MDSKMKRREFLKISALAGVAVVAAACTPTAVPATAVPAATAVPKVAATAVPATAVPKPTAVPATAVPKPTVVPTKAGFQGEIEFYAATYTPSSVANNPDPKAPKREAIATLADEWRALHPGIKFTLFQPPSEADYAGSWLNTQLIGGGGPDVFWLWLNPLNQMADEGKVVALNDYLELPNKYTPEDKTSWLLSFNSPFPTTFSVKGQWGGIAIDQVSTGIYANVDMFKAQGIDLSKELDPELGSPKDWVTLVSWCKKFKEAGFFGFSVNLDDPGGWFPRVLLSQLFWSLTDIFDVLNYYENTPKAFQEGIISQEEIIMQYACNGWKPFSEPATRTQFEIIKDLTQYFPAGFAGKVGASQAEPTSASDLFMQGQLAMLWDGSWQIGPFMQDNRRKFEFTSFWVPPLTKETTPLAHDPPILPIGVGGIGTSYGINHKCIAKGNVDECVDWLMYISTPKNDELIVNEVPSMIPSVKKARGLPEIASMFVGETRLLAGAKRPWNPIAWWFGYADNKYSDTMKRETDLYLLNEQDLDTFMANMEVAAQEDLPATIRAAAIQYSKDGSWDLTRWKCQPTV